MRLVPHGQGIPYPRGFDDDEKPFLGIVIHEH